MNPYASFLAGQEPLSIIRSTPDRLRTFVSSFRSSAINQLPDAGKWSVRDVLAHLADTELVFGMRLRQSIAEDYHTIQPFDQERWAKPYAGLDANAALAAFEAIRRWNLAFLEQIEPADYAKKLTHPERGEVTFNVLVETMAGHDLNHFEQLNRLAVAFASGPSSSAAGK
ncbi:MAG TPA: DinB family protein [Bryobacteraceae bacterium]|nr:DinB family protein [Bryobacteraceae bacterium]